MARQTYIFPNFLSDLVIFGYCSWIIEIPTVQIGDDSQTIYFSFRINEPAVQVQGRWEKRLDKKVA